jgi:hypothetical protein
MPAPVRGVDRPGPAPRVPQRGEHIQAADALFLVSPLDRYSEGPRTARPRPPLSPRLPPRRPSSRSTGEMQHRHLARKQAGRQRHSSWRVGAACIPGGLDSGRSINLGSSYSCCSLAAGSLPREQRRTLTIANERRVATHAGDACGCGHPATTPTSHAGSRCGRHGCVGRCQGRAFSVASRRLSLSGRSLFPFPAAAIAVSKYGRHDVRGCHAEAAAAAPATVQLDLPSTRRSASRRYVPAVCGDGSLQCCAFWRTSNQAVPATTPGEGPSSAQPRRWSRKVLPTNVLSNLFT